MNKNFKVFFSTFNAVKTTERNFMLSDVFSFKVKGPSTSSMKDSEMNQRHERDNFNPTLSTTHGKSRMF